MPAVFSGFAGVAVKNRAAMNAGAAVLGARFAQVGVGAPPGMAGMKLRVWVRLPQA